MRALPGTLLLLSVFVTGFSALVYEVIWQRELAYIIGSQARSTAIILAVFLGALSLGYLGFGSISRGRSSRSLVAWCGVAEALIGVWALAFQSIKAVAINLAESISPTHDLIFLWDSLICVTLIGVPSFLMGVTLPLLTQGISSSLKDASENHAKIYALNTAGAFIGCLAAGFVIVPSFGLEISMFNFGILNVVIGALIVGLSFCFPAQIVTTPALDRFEHGERIFSPLMVAFLAGFSSIALQTLLMRLTGLSLGSSEYAFSMIVAAYIGLLSFGAFVINVRARPLIPLWVNQLLSSLSLLVLFVTVFSWPYFAHVVRTLFTSTVPSFYAFHATAFMILFLVLLIPVGCMGSAMPLLFDAVKDDSQKLGKTVGKLYAVNALGCVFGAIFGGYLLLYQSNLDGVFKLILLGLLLSFFCSLPRATLKKGASLILALSFFGAFTAALIFLPAWDYFIFAHGTFRSQMASEHSYRGAKEFYSWFQSDSRLSAYKDGPNTTVAVTESGEAEQLSRSILVNGKSDGATGGGDRSTTKLLAHLAGLFGAEASGRVGVIGFGTGITVGSLTQYSTIAEISVFELSADVQRFSPLFDFANHNASKSPKLKWQIGDAYRLLGFSNESYDSIVSEPSNPWVAGVEQLYAKEFLERVRGKLSSAGVYAQWFHTYSMHKDTFAMIVRTFSEVFPHIRIFLTGSDVILVGSLGELGLSKLKLALSRYEALPEVRADLSDIEISSFDLFLGREILIGARAFWRAPLHTLSHPKLSYMAGKDFFRGNDVDVEGYLLTAAARSWSNALLPKSLLNLLALEIKDPKYPLPLLAKRACGRDVNEFFKGWEQAPLLCRALLLTAWISNIPVQAEASVAEDLSKLRLLVRGQNQTDSQCVPDTDVAESYRSVMRFGKRFVPGIGLDHEILICRVAPCFVERSEKAKECRVRLIEALAFTGRPELARLQLEAYKKDIGEISDSISTEVSVRQLIEDSELGFGEKAEKYGENN